MTILTYFLIVLINCQIDFKNHRKIFKKEDCSNARYYDLNKVLGQIKYLSIIQFFQQEYDADFEYYNLFFQQQEKQKIELQNSLKILKQILVIKEAIQKRSQFKKIEDNNNPLDSRVEYAFKQLKKIEKFLNIFQWGVKFLSYEKAFIDLDSPHQDLFWTIIHNYYSASSIRLKLERLIQDYKTCQGHDFHIDLIQLNQSSQADEQVEPLVISKQENNLKTLQISEFQGYNLQDYESEVQIKDCRQKLPIIQSLHLEFQKLSELLDFKSNYKIEVFQQFLNEQDQLIIDSIPILNYIKGVQINEKIIARYDKLYDLLTDQQISKIFQVEFPFIQKINSQLQDISEYSIYSIYEVFQSRLKIYLDLSNYKMLMDDSLKLFSFDKTYYEVLQQSFESLISHIKDFDYSQEYIQKGIKYFKRDILICSNVKDQNQAKYVIQNQDESCQQKLQNIEQKIYQYQQANELNRLDKQTDHYDSIFNKLKQINKEIFTIIENMDKYQQMFEISEKLYFIEIYPTHNDPEDKESVQAYENLIKLQNLLVNLLNAFSKADEFLDFNIKDINSYEAQYLSLKKNFSDKVYINNYSERNVHSQLKMFTQDYEQCFDNKQKFYDNYQIFDKDNSQQDYYYWLNKKYIQKKPQNLLILPLIVQQFEKEDISNYQKLSYQCKIDIEGIFEDIIETLKIIQLLKYKQQGQIQYDAMIFQALEFKKEFLEQAKQLYLTMENLNLPQKLRFFRIIQNQSIDEGLQNKFNQLHSFNDNLGYFAFSYQNSIDLLKFNDQDFNQIEENQKLVNDYLKGFQKYQLNDMQYQLDELYHRYKQCTGYEFLYDFCRLQEEQNIYGGICQKNCLYEPKKTNIIQQDIKMENTKKHKNIQKLYGQKTKHSKIKYKKRK